ncbi:LuxR C-terminal-related transcriptional regulator [Pseudomonas sp. NPDC090755]|uniref:LuxR C-terminal-related transcriptional regulator n=1 Tax=Pseudomonas sp. NPDC090755 TaxID=3364481 RepID=UPI00383B036F
MHGFGPTPVAARSQAARLPRLPASYLSRPRLLQALATGQPRLRLLCAPAGFGKTALLCEFLQQVPCDQRIVWLSLAGSRQTAGGLRTALALELGLAPDIDAQALLQRLDASVTSLWLVFDDLPHDLGDELNEWIEQLLALPGGRVQLLVTCRRRPDWNLPRLRLAGEQLELGAADLAFQRGEFEALVALLNPQADPRTLEAIWQDAGSWCTGIRLLLDASTQGGTLQSPLLQEYLKHEVLSRLTPAHCQMLYGLACLPRVSEQLCDELWEGEEGAAVFRRLLQSQAFLMPVQGHANWYRLLPAVARALQGRLGERATNHLRLQYCRLMSASGHFDVAIEQALLAERPEVAVSYMQRLRLSWLISDRNLNRFMVWRERLPASLLDSSPRLIFLCTRALMFRGRLDEADGCLRQIGRFLPHADPAFNRRLLANWEALHGTVQAMRGKGEAARLHCRAALAELTPQDWLSTLLCHSTLARVQLIAGDLSDAQHLLEEGVQLARRQGSQDGEVLLNTDRFRLMSLRGELQLAEALLCEDVQRLQEHTVTDNPLLGRLLFLRGELLLAQDRLDEAEQALQEGMFQVQDSCAPFVMSGYVLQIEIAVRRGRLEQAQVLLHAAERRMHCGNVDGSCYLGAIELLKMRIFAGQGAWTQVLAIARGLEEHLQGPRPSLPPLHLPTLAQRNQLLQAQAEFATGDSALAVCRLRTLLQQCERVGWRRLGEEAQALLATCEHHPASPTYSVPSYQDALTPREISVLKLLADGMSIREVGDSLFISVNTVKSHAKNINIKLGAVRRTQAISCAKAMGILA